MISGRKALIGIEQALSGEQDKIRRLDQQASELSERQILQEQENLADYRELARLRVDLISRELADSKLDRAEQLVLGILEQRKGSLDQIENELAAAVQQLRQQAAEREVQEASLEELSERIDQAEKITQDRLDAEPAYAEQRSMAVEAERIAVHAETKAEQSEDELESKGKPYRDDQLFMYLWQRRYGSPDYQVGKIIRSLDGWVARLIGYNGARANFYRLKEIPVRLRNHAEKLRKAAEEKYAGLHELDRKAREEDGITVLDGELEEGQKRIESIDVQSEQITDRIAQLEQREAQFASGDDEQFRSAIDYMSGELREKELGYLHRTALSTPFPEDDEVVAKLLQRERDREDVSESLGELKQLRQRHESRVAELEQLKRDFKRNRFDSAGSGFADGGMLALALGEFLQGMVSREAFWKILEQQRRYQRRQADPDFGSGGFGRGTMWGGGRTFPGRVQRGNMRFPRAGSGRRPGGFRLPSGGGSRGGGFRTGGGF